MTLILVAIGLTALQQALPAYAAISLVQSKENYNGSTAGGINAAFTSNNTAGNTIAVAFAFSSTYVSSDGPPVCSDTKGNSYSVAVHASDDNKSLWHGICYATNIAAGPNTVSVNPLYTTYFQSIFITEYSGIDTSNPVDTAALNSTGLTNQDSEGITTTGALAYYDGDLIFAAAAEEGSANWTAGSGYTQRSATNHPLTVQDKVQTSAGVAEAKFSVDTHGDDYRASLVAFRAAGASLGTLTGIQYLQTAAYDGGSSGGTSTSATFVNNNKAGNTIVVSFSSDSLDSGITCSDTRGNTYTSLINGNDYSVAQGDAVCYATNIAAGANTVTVTMTNGHAFRFVQVSEYSGIDTTNPIDAYNVNTMTTDGTIDNLTSNAVTTSANGDLIYGHLSAYADLVKPGTGFTLRNDVGNASKVVDKIQPSAGSVAVTGTTFSAWQSATAILVAFRPTGGALPVASVAQGDAIANFTLESHSNPHWASYTDISGQFGPNQTGPLVSGGHEEGHHTVTRTSPTKLEAISGYETLSGLLQIQCFNGTQWTNEWSVNVGVDPNGDNIGQRFDIAYETSSGDVMVLYSTDATTTNELAYRTKSGSTGCGSTNWSSATNLNPVRTSDTVEWVKLAWDRRSTSDLITAVWADKSRYLSAMQWSGSAWGNEPSAALDSSLQYIDWPQANDPFDVEYESLSGDVMVALGDSVGSNGTNGAYYVTCTGGTASCTWSSTTAMPTFSDEAAHIDLSANPLTDEIVFASASTYGDVQIGYWSGSAWTNTANAVTGGSEAHRGQQLVATGWLKSGSTTRSIVAYVGNNTVRNFTGNGSTFTLAGSYPSYGFGTDNEYLRLQTDPFHSDKMLMAVGGDDQWLEIKRASMDGSGVLTWNDTASDNMALDLGASPSFSVAYWRNIYPSPVLNQESYRLFANADSTDVGAALAAQDTAATAPAQGTPFRLRMLIHNTGAQWNAGASGLKLQVATRSGTCDTAFSGESYSDVSTGSGAIRYFNNTTPSDGATATSNANDPSDAHTKVMQSYEEANNAAVVAHIPYDYDGEWDFSLVDYSATGGTTYCFRVINTDGTTLNTYTSIPQITTAITNTPPSDPSALAQFKNDGTTSISTGGYTNETSVVLKGTVSDPDSDNTALCVEVASSLSSPASPSTCGTAVSSGSTASVTASSLASGTTYKWQAKSKDSSNVYSSTYTQFNSGNGAFTVDTAAPTTGSVYDGSSAGVDGSYNDGSLSSLSCNWSGFADSISGIASYDYSIGITAGGTTVLAWTNVGSGTTSVTPTGLTLQTGQLYYCNVRANDNAGNTSSIVSSNGQLVAPTLTFSVSSSSLDFAPLIASNGYSDTQSLIVTTSTNAYGGYSIRQYAAALTSGSNSIAAFNGGTYASPDAWQPGDTGLGYTSSDTSVGGSNKFQSATCPGGSTLAAPGCYAPIASSANGDVVADHTTAVTGTEISNETYTLSFHIKVPSTQAAGNYTTVLTLVCTPTY